MTDHKTDVILEEIKRDLIADTNESKEAFSSSLSKELASLAGQLDPKQREQLQSLSVDKVVNDVSSSIVDWIIKKIRGWVNPIHVIPLYTLTPEATVRLLGKQPTKEEALQLLTVTLTDTVAASYTALTAQAIYEALSVDPRKEEHDQPCEGKSIADLKRLISNAAMNASPVRPRYSADGLQRDRINWAAAAKAAKKALDTIGTAITVYQVVDFVKSLL